MKLVLGIQFYFLIFTASALAGGVLPTGLWSQKISVKVKQVVTGADHTCAILEDSTLKCWGYNGFGQLGLGSTTNFGVNTTQIADGLPTINLGTGRTVLQVAAGANNTCALLDNSQVKCWGYNFLGQLGQGNTVSLGDGANEMGNNLPAIDLGTGRTAVQIGVGLYHICALLDNFAVKCWGNNAEGQLGQGHTAHLGDDANEMGNNLPVINLGAGRTARQIAVGVNHTCALLDNSTLKCWGKSNVGALGQGTNVNLGDGANEMGDNLPAINLGAGRTAVQVAVGEIHTCALLDNSTVKCWGANSVGQLGQGTVTNLGDGAGEMGDSLPAIDLGSGRTALRITAGQLLSCAILDNLSVKCWGRNNQGQLGQGSTLSLGDGANEMGDNLPAINLGDNLAALQIVSGSSHTCALLTNSTVKCWGRSNYGQLGLGNSIQYGNGPNQMGNNLPEVRLGTSKSRLKKVLSTPKGSLKRIAVSAFYSCAILDNSQLKCWGTNNDGQLGLGHTNEVGDGLNEMGDNLPAVDLGTGRIAVQIYTGYSHTCALLNDSTVKCWGSGAFGQLGNGSNAKLGDQPNEMGDNLTAINLGSGRRVVQMAVGSSHSCAILDDGTTKCWGHNLYGQLGRGSTAHIGDGANEMGDNLPVLNLGTGRRAIQISAGGFHTCALLDDSSVKCWGRNSTGQLGQGQIANLGDGVGEMGDSLPVVNLGTGRRAVQISLGYASSCALLDDSTVKCWGENNNGQLGQGTNARIGDGPNEMGDNLLPINLGSGRLPLHLFSGVGHHTCALLEDSSVKCWGQNNGGQLGQGHFDNVGDSPGEMGDSLPLVDLGVGRSANGLAVGALHTCTILDNSMVKCFGNGSSGALGQGNDVDLGDELNEMGDHLKVTPLGTFISSEKIFIDN